MKSRKVEEKLLGTLQDFTSRENWDEFFKLRSDEPFEWYGDWRNLAKPLAEHCGLVPSEEKPVDILVPGCGNSELSEKLYDAGFKRITNIDFSKVVIGNMLRKHLRARPGMLWRVMDMTNMQPLIWPCGKPVVWPCEGVLQQFLKLVLKESWSSF